MITKVAIIGLGIMGNRMLKHMKLHDDFQPDFLWDPDETKCLDTIKENPDSKIMNSPSEAIKAADLIYLACPPIVRKVYAVEAASLGKSLFLEKPFGIDIQDSFDLIKKLGTYNIPIAVNFTQASGVALNDLLESKNNGEMGSLLGVDIVVTYPSWPRLWQKEADWLRFRKEGGMTREVISHFLFFSERVLGPLKVVWAKSRTHGTNWTLGFNINSSINFTDAFALNQNYALEDYDGYWNDTAPTSSVVSLGAHQNTNKSGENYIAYCFSEKQGYSKFGSYTGNGNADGTFIYTGFKPSWVMRKKSSAASQWTINDTARDPFNMSKKGLTSNSNAAEDDANGYWDMDFLSNGFKMRTTETEVNGSGATFIYMAFAENPFVTSTGIPATAR